MKRIVFALSAAVLCLAGCDSGKFVMQEPEGCKVVKEMLDKSLDGNKEVESLTLKAKEELYGEFEDATITYWVGDIQMTQRFNRSKGLQKPDTAYEWKNNSPIKPQKKATCLIKDFDVSQVPGKVGEAAGMISKLYKDFSLYRWTFTAAGNHKSTSTFQLNATKKGEGSTQNGKMISTKYYEFHFSVDENGRVTLDS